MKLSSILIILFTFACAIFFLSCKTDYIGNAESYLKSALREVDDIRRYEWLNIDSHEEIEPYLDTIEKYIENALNELSNTHPSY